MIQLPDKFSDTLPLDESDKKKFTEALNELPPVSVRINPRKIESQLPLEKVSWCNDGYYLAQRPIFTFDPVFHAGGYYVQEASSMMIGEIVKNISNQHTLTTALDMCASPGGKSTHLLSVLPEDALLICNEVVPARIGALNENILKWGNGNVCITQNDAADFSVLDNLFDLILVDAPCSGEGMFRKEEAALSEWSLKNVEMCSVRQKNILQNIIPALKPGGFLIYSTCTYNEKENEENVKFLLANFDLEIFDVSELSRPGVQISGNTMRFFPHATKGEGLFIAVFKKKETDFTPFKVKKNNLKKTTSFVGKNHLISAGEGFTFTDNHHQISFFPEKHFSLIETLRKYLRFHRTGTFLGEQKGAEFIPSHELFLSNYFDKKSFPAFELSYEEAVNFLSKESISFLPDHKGRGYFTYQSLPLGSYKSVPGRINNNFPKDLKIRKKYDAHYKFSLLSL